MPEFTVDGGRMTGITSGEILQVDVTVDLQYGQSAMSAGGDTSSPPSA